MLRARRWWPLLAALLAGACGSNAHSSTAGSATIPSDPKQAVQQALAALSNRAFDESFTQVGRLHVTGAAPATAARLNARLRNVRSTETGLVQFTDVHDFQAKITTSDSGTQYIRASGGKFLVSSDGVHYQPGPAAEEQTFDSLAQTGLSFLSRGAEQVQDKGPRTVDGTATEEYTGIFPGSAIKAQFGSLVDVPAGSSFGRGTMTIDISRAAGVPVRVVDVLSLTTDLATFEAGLRGSMITVVTSTRSFAHFGPAH